jgi:hypothetical protein
MSQKLRIEGDGYWRTTKVFINDTELKNLQGLKLHLQVGHTPKAILSVSNTIEVPSEIEADLMILSEDQGMKDLLVDIGHFLLSLDVDESTQVHIDRWIMHIEHKLDIVFSDSVMVKGHYHLQRE